MTVHQIYVVGPGFQVMVEDSGWEALRILLVDLEVGISSRVDSRGVSTMDGSGMRDLMVMKTCVRCYESMEGVDLRQGSLVEMWNGT